MKEWSKRRAYGQHFLTSQPVISEIVDHAIALAQESNSRTLLEIGPGQGAITVPLSQRLSQTSVERLILIEKDRDLAKDWEARLPQAQVHAIDFLKSDTEIWSKNPPVTVVSNLPYSSGTAIFQILAGRPDVIPVMVLMFQAEVAKRLRASPGTRDQGSLSLWTQNKWDVQKLISVPPGAFSPPPKVQSEVIVLRARPELRLKKTAQNPDLWQKLLKACFANRRKMLRSGLSSSTLWSKTLKASGVDNTKRAEALEWEEWEALYEAALQIDQP